MSSDRVTAKQKLRKILDTTESPPRTVLIGQSLEFMLGDICV
jgi:hypothetical protein